MILNEAFCVRANPNLKHSFLHKTQHACVMNLLMFCQKKRKEKNRTLSPDENRCQNMSEDDSAFIFLNCIIFARPLD